MEPIKVKVELEVKVEDNFTIKTKPKLHIWNQILEDDELSEKLAASMNRLGDQFARRFIRRKRNKKNKKKKKGPNTSNNNTGTSNTNGTLTQANGAKPEIKSLGKPEHQQPQTSQQTQKLQQPHKAQQPQHSQTPQQTQLLQQPQKPQQLQNPQQKPQQPQQLQKPRKPQQPKISNPLNDQHKGGSSKLSKRKSKLPNSILQEEAMNISRKLKEKRIDLIIRTIRLLGLDEAMKLCSEVLNIEQAGGLMTMNGTRRRTPGGIFFHLIKNSGRYEASIVSKIFKDGENKEPVYKPRIKSRNVTAQPTTVASLSNERRLGNINCALIAPVTTVQSTQPAIQQAIQPATRQVIQPATQPAFHSAIQPEIQPVAPIVSIDQPVKQPEQSTQLIHSFDLKSSNLNADVKMEAEDDDMENSNLVIVEYDSVKIKSEDTHQNSDQLIRCTFPINSNSSDFNILCQPSTVTSEKPSKINSNVTMFTTNRISVDA